jgi:type IV fimbrial biogenesis protein FimT
MLWGDPVRHHDSEADHPMNSHVRMHGGFSLVELMIVISLFGVLVAIGVPSILGYMHSARINGAATTLEADFHYARSVASSQRRTCQVRFSGGSYVLLGVAAGDTILRRTLPGGMTLASTDTATFYAWGLTDPVTVTMSDHGKTQILALASNGSIDHHGY